jgi:hypothetical protein
MKMMKMKILKGKREKMEVMKEMKNKIVMILTVKQEI